MASDPVPQGYVDQFRNALKLLHEPDLVAGAFVTKPEKLETARAAIEVALQAVSGDVPDCPQVDVPFKRSRVEALVDRMQAPALWVASGFSRRQLAAIRSAFMQAQPLLEEKLHARECRADEAKAKAELTRRVQVSEALRLAE